MHSCYYNSGCQPFVCGLHLFGLNGMDDERIQDLRDDIGLLQAQGALVKMAFGGEEWGNPGAMSKVRMLRTYRLLLRMLLLQERCSLKSDTWCCFL